MWYTKYIYIATILFFALFLGACANNHTPGTDGNEPLEPGTTETVETEEEEPEMDYLNDPDSVVYYLERGIDPKTGDAKIDKSVCLVLNGDRYQFVGEGAEFDFMVQYLGSKSGVWELVPFSDSEDNTVFYVDSFTVNLYEEDAIHITSSPLTSDTYTFRKKTEYQPTNQ